MFYIKFLFYNIFFFNKKVLNFEDEYKRMLKIDKKYIKKLFNLIDFDKVLVGFT